MRGAAQEWATPGTAGFRARRHGEDRSMYCSASEAARRPVRTGVRDKQCDVFLLCARHCTGSISEQGCVAGAVESP